MNEEEKRFKIEKIEKYNEERKDMKNHIENMAVIGFLSLAALVGGIGNIAELSNIPGEYTTEFLSYSSSGLVCLGVPIGITSIIELIKGIKDKTNIEKSIDEINEELDLLEQQEEPKSRGGR